MAMTITSSVRSELTKRKLQPPGQSVAKMEELEVVFVEVVDKVDKVDKVELVDKVEVVDKVDKVDKVEVVDKFKLLSIKSSSMLSTLSSELSMSASP